MESIQQIFENYSGPLLNKWDSYIDIYDYYFSPYRNKELVFLEIGVAHGGSLQFWQQYFGDKIKIYGIDVNPECKKFESENVKIFIGSQEDPVFLESVKKSIPPIDILLDDGGHTMKQQVTTFNVLFDHVKSDGIYMCEDLQTSYYKNFGGGLRRAGTFIEFSKRHIDNLHGWFAKKGQQQEMFNKITSSVWGIHYHNAVVVYLKKTVKEPRNLFKGYETITIGNYAVFGQKKSITGQLKRLMLRFRKRS
ncbi:class I SAM-dependent methyltransferase [Niabella beijingensis]|uniref:class I SAM-dependent methyltransferase n=1 Tax=Niabella beijingensis TaxID=2872700 RepID=UPI001CBC6B99|nr:class I SAM-dependent methyltransferase [Niabella beijingensis]MBZ4191096.1 class I SAM-dependent methyltransferase [Niabella beijingensis]